MAGGMKVSWIKGPRTTASGKDQGGKMIERKGKNGGVCVVQKVVRVHSPR